MRNAQVFFCSESLRFWKKYSTFVGVGAISGTGNVDKKVYFIMLYKKYFDPKDRTQMTGVWKDVFNLFTDLRDESYEHIDGEEQAWHDIKLNEYRFINIVRTIYEKLNTPNSRCLVKDYHHQLSRAEISKDGFREEQGNQIIRYCNSHITEYERNIIFGGLYYVLYKQRESLVEPEVVEKVKQIACANRIPSLHYFYYFEAALVGRPIISSDPVQTSGGRSVEEYDKAFENSCKIENYKLWIESILETQRQYLPEDIQQALHDLRKCLEVCQKSLPLGGLKPQACGETILVPKGTSPDTIADFIKEEFPTIYIDWKKEQEDKNSGTLNVETETDELPPLFCLDSHSASVIENKIKEAVNITSKVQACANLYGLQKKGYINLNQYGSDEVRAKVLNQHQDKHTFSADDVQRGRTKST